MKRRASPPSAGMSSQSAPRTVAELREHGIRILEGARVPTPDDRVAFVEAIERRAAREPLQHITGVAAFRSLELAVGPGVFIPRPETEFVTQLAIDALLEVPGGSPRVIDLGTGSG